MTAHVLAVLRALAAVPGREMYGLEIIRASALPAGTVYPLLGRTENAGWVAARDEDISPQAEGHFRDRYYRITPAGAEAVREAMARDAERLAALGITVTPAVAARPPAASKGKCVHRVPPGSYCTRCGRPI